MLKTPKKHSYFGNCRSISEHFLKGNRQTLSQYVTNGWGTGIWLTGLKTLHFSSMFKSFMQKMGQNDNVLSLVHGKKYLHTAWIQ